jgi:hypothetical protein
MLLIPGILASRFTPQGDFESIATSIVGAGGVSSITFSSIPSTYQHLQIRGHINAPDDWSFRFNSDTGTNYSAHLLYGTGSSTVASALTNLARGYIGYGAGSGNLGSFVLDILDYKDTNKYKTTRALAGYDINGSGIIMFNSSSWRNTAAVSTITIFPSSGSLAQHSHFALYGIKG